CTTESWPMGSRTVVRRPRRPETLRLFRLNELLISFRVSRLVYFWYLLQCIGKVLYCFVTIRVVQVRLPRFLMGLEKRLPFRSELKWRTPDSGTNEGFAPQRVGRYANPCLATHVAPIPARSVCV